MNSIVVLGRLGKDVELTYNDKGTAIAKFTVGSTRSSNREVTDWFNVVAFGARAETISQYFNKGSEILLQCEVQLGNYTNKDGIKVYTTTLVVNNFNFTGGSKKAENTSNNNSNIDNDYGTPIDDGDMPF